MNLAFVVRELMLFERVGDPERDEPSENVPLRGGEEPLVEQLPQKLFAGVWVPGVDGTVRGGRRASAAARRSRFVVPRAFVEPDLAEQTMASLC